MFAAVAVDVAVFAAAAITAFRNEMLIGLLAPVLIGAYFPWKRWLPVVSQFAFGALVIVACFNGHFFQLRAAEWRYPAGAAAFLAEHHIDAPLFNTYEYGGYLIWKGERVFIDGRALSESVFQDYRGILGAPPNDSARAGLLAKYGIGAMKTRRRWCWYSISRPACRLWMPAAFSITWTPSAACTLRTIPTCRVAHVHWATISCAPAIAPAPAARWNCISSTPTPEIPTRAARTCN